VIAEVTKMLSTMERLKAEQEAIIKRKEVEGVSPVMGELLRTKLAGKSEAVKLRDLRLFTTEDTGARPGMKMGHMIWYDVARARLSDSGT
jgi:hypothetical protein